MGNVGISIKVMPKTPEVDLNKVLENIKKKLNVQDSRIEPLAFGLKCLKLLIVVPDKTGANTDKMEAEIAAVDGVENVEVENVTLI